MTLTSLHSADLRRLVESGYRIQEIADPEQLAWHAQEVFQQLVGADLVVWNELTADGKVSTGMTFPDLGVRFWERVAPGMLAHINEHPFVQHLGKRPCSAFTAALSDFLPTRRFMQTGLYSVGYRDFAAKHQISSAVGIAGGEYLVVSLNRRSKDFCDRDKTILDAVTRQASQAYQNLRRFDSLQSQIAALAEGRSPLETTWLYVDARLIVTWADANWESYLLRHFAHRRFNLFLPPVLADAIQPLPAPPGSGQTVKRACTCHQLSHRSSSYRLTVLAERANRFRITIAQLATDQHMEGYPGLSEILTRREVEVAHWAALGKTNPEIAIILGISSRTVEKHVHAALAKLRLENRVQLARTLAGNATAAMREPVGPQVWR